ncbi:hypothetical protein SH601_14070 [Gracilibacillus sp. S3-1-1]|uniref:Uncharacterized protein n=1 Tax=Gracilibacillus pellucidus TaxID=3095368 RepID=A0ACC6M849_9BACI|nr:hypothetical protein [Gracilibacillus sp. S3-1-1]MDX8047114.1 hypothetical protein [Gracilibacillus sp. S3-1-1]
MIVQLPIWFIFIAHILGVVLVFLGLRIWIKEETFLIESIGVMKEGKDITTLCKFVGQYSVALGVIILALPLLHYWIDSIGVLIIITSVLIISVIFWATIHRQFFIPKQGGKTYEQN